MEHIYVDHAATSPMHPKVIEKMHEVMQQAYGNPSSIHTFGRQARKIIDNARNSLAASIGAQETEIIITSGGTEADNHAIFGVADSYQHKGKHIITTEIEHHAVLIACQELEKKGFDVTYLPVNEFGVIDLDVLKRELRDDTILVTIMYGNNEVGAIQPITEIGELLVNHQALFHTDAVQAYGVEDIDVKKQHINLLSVSSHKINGPKGIGFLYLENGIQLSPRLFGGEQERKRRAGTENVPALAAFQLAAEIAISERLEKRQKYEAYKNILVQILKEHKIEFQQNGLVENTLPHVLNLSFPGTNVEALLVNLDLAGIAASSGSACTAGSIDPSHVLVSMYGENSERTKNSIRFSFGLYNTEEQIKHVGSELSKIVQRLTAK
ncbi:cysteine desulfurase family protein [Niallia taxi]|uniref:Cysteine desulfurase n=1 Tax=Niallia taxi TaxID=2499688 RepID=A0A3S2TVW3_9BACI|nr:cysteine desulfurase family protein [Niallia taxi]MCM3215262.1 cysteine desulfurase [Niallia taxi]MDK8639563.1 cysteine desulfurase family protein [Niallia taxi]MED4037937.1 cysteine desulfurase family protein [Niallia taxi]MED4055851.1 cysteine desulfurase family protein [Niallia taxi]MED4117847.1 cysteine desulfurase family protein [Niallia taxi]